jgi:hypothetical protein
LLRDSVELLRSIIGFRTKLIPGHTRSKFLVRLNIRSSREL